MWTPRFAIICIVLGFFIKSDADLLKIFCENATIELRCSEENARTCCEVDEAAIQSGGSGCADKVNETLRMLKREPCSSPTGPPVVRMLTPGQVNTSLGQNVSLMAVISRWIPGNCSWTHGSSKIECANASLSQRTRVTSVTRSSETSEGNTLTKEFVTEVALSISGVTSEDAGMYLLRVCSSGGCHEANFDVTVGGASTTPPALTNATKINNATDLPPPTPGDDSPNVGLIVGVVVGVIFGLILIIIIIMVGCYISGLRKFRRRYGAFTRVKREDGSNSDTSRDVEMSDL